MVDGCFRGGGGGDMGGNWKRSDSEVEWMMTLEGPGHCQNTAWHLCMHKYYLMVLTHTTSTVCSITQYNLQLVL